MIRSITSEGFLNEEFSVVLTFKKIDREIFFFLGGDNSNAAETGSPTYNTHNRPVRAWTVHAGNHSNLAVKKIVS